MSNSPLDAGIPVLTEIIPAPAVDETAVAEIPAPVSAPLDATIPASPSADLASPVRRSMDDWDEAEWEKLERQVAERVLGQILTRVDAVLEQRVRDSLADVLQVAVDRLANEIRDGLHHSIKNAVERAVAQEIAILQTSKT